MATFPVHFITILLKLQLFHQNPLENMYIKQTQDLDLGIFIRRIGELLTFQKPVFIG